MTPIDFQQAKEERQAKLRAELVSLLDDPHFPGKQGIDQVAEQVAFDEEGETKLLRIFRACGVSDLEPNGPDFETVANTWYVLVTDVGSNLRAMTGESWLRSVFTATSKVWHPTFLRYLEALWDANPTVIKQCASELGIIAGIPLGSPSLTKGPIGPAPMFSRDEEKAKAEYRAKLLARAKASRKSRPHAGENAAVNYLLSQLLSNNGPLLEDNTVNGMAEIVFKGFADQEGAGQNPRTHFIVILSHRGQKLNKIGLNFYMDCPEPGKSAFLFNQEPMERLLDRSSLKKEWRELLDGVLGFDSDWKLLNEDDLAWWKQGRSSQRIPGG
jgi:hypothetical protein